MINTKFLFWGGAGRDRSGAGWSSVGRDARGRSSEPREAEGSLWPVSSRQGLSPWLSPFGGGVLLSSFFECLGQCPWRAVPLAGSAAPEGSLSGGGFGRLLRGTPAPAGAPLPAGGGRGRVSSGAPRRRRGRTRARGVSALPGSLACRFPPRRLPPSEVVPSPGGPRGSADGLAVLSAPKRSPLPAAPGETVLALAAWRVTLGLRSGSTRWIKETRPLCVRSFSPFSGLTGSVPSSGLAFRSPVESEGRLPSGPQWPDSRPAASSLRFLFHSPSAASFWLGCGVLSWWLWLAWMAGLIQSLGSHQSLMGRQGLLWLATSRV